MKSFVVAFCMSMKNSESVQRWRRKEDPEVFGASTYYWRAESSDFSNERHYLSQNSYATVTIVSATAPSFPNSSLSNMRQFGVKKSFF